LGCDRFATDKTEIMNLSQFAALIKKEREVVLSSWRKQVRELSSAEGLDTPTLTDHMPKFLDELAVAFDKQSNPPIEQDVSDTSPQIHGLQRLKDGFDISDVVAEYNILRACIHDLASEHEYTLQGQPFRILNRVFDDGIGMALQTYATSQALAVQQKRQEYLAFVVHDLRTPLSAISLAARVLEKKLPIEGYTGDSAQMIKSLQRSVQQLELLVRKVLEENTHLDTVDGVELQRREFDVWPMIETLIETLQPVATAAGVTILNEVHDELIIYADAGAMRRVFQNLIANAIKHSPNGTVTVSACQSTDTHQVEFSVRDSGVGISEGVRSKIFEKGKTDFADGDIAGLGLAIVKMLVHAHAGEIRVESAVGQGSNFIIELPLKKEAM
jgi:two-component system, OmpR family, phosphate regulon sensor histidine kinase PhoR